VFDTQGGHAIEGVEELAAAELSLEIVLHDDLVDVCVGNGRCLINRFPEQRGDHWHLFCQDGWAIVTLTTL
jgi:hypothetical protein